MIYENMYLFLWLDLDEKLSKSRFSEKWKHSILLKVFLFQFYFIHTSCFMIQDMRRKVLSHPLTPSLTCSSFTIKKNYNFVTINKYLFCLFFYEYKKIWKQTPDLLTQIALGIQKRNSEQQYLFVRSHLSTSCMLKTVLLKRDRHISPLTLTIIILSLMLSSIYITVERNGSIHFQFITMA